MSLTLTHNIAILERVGNTTVKYLAKLGITTVEDLLYHFPFRYEDYRNLCPIDQAPADVPITLKGKIQLIANKRSPRKRTMLTEAVVGDESGQIRVVWFGQGFLTKQLHVGDEVYLSGQIKNDRFGRQMTSPQYEKIVKNSDGTHTARIVPMYPLTKGLTQKQLRFFVSQVIDLVDQVEEWLPEQVLDDADVLSLSEAMRQIHFPESQEALAAAEKRLKFDELFILQLRAALIRSRMTAREAPVIAFAEDAVKSFVSALPFQLTGDQKKAAWAILQDLQEASPMNRLVEGDVGSGKTVVAALVSHNSALAGKQVAIMAPTAILAQQHYQSFCELLGAEHRIALLTSAEANVYEHDFKKKSKKGKRDELLALLVGGEIDILIGTHAVITDDVAFQDLALVIVDEQHRFGVEQRRRIRDKSGDPNTSPHFLSMTATPIPRSLALTLYGDLDISLIKEMPAGRKSVNTRVVASHERSNAYDFVATEMKEGRQVFVICPRIEPGTEEEGGNALFQADEKKSVMKEYKRLSEEVFPQFRVAYVHGKMRPKEKDAVMAQFAAGEIDMLVSTSVVEVGVNVPNASVMLIEGAEQFGLAQLHQFRGRVGRGSQQAYCFLFPTSMSHHVEQRLRFFASTTDGFKVAAYDLQQRGPGEVYGVNQSGMQQFRLASLRDVELIELAREIAKRIDFDTYPALKERVVKWEERVHLE